MSKISVIGVAGEEMSESGRKGLAQAEIVIGTERLLKLPEIPAAAQRFSLTAEFLAHLPEFLRENRARRIVILASGDPLYHGIGGTLARWKEFGEVRFFPAPTAFQELFARLGLPWQEALLLSLHGKKTGIPARRILHHRLAAIYGDNALPPRRIAQALVEAFPEAAWRPAAVGCRLGSREESILRGTLAEIAANPLAEEPLSVLAILPYGEEDEGRELPGLPLGLPDEEYRHFARMITHPEIRAIVLAKLRLTPGVLWDLGAGSGSVGLEAAGLCPELQVFLVEKNPERVEDILKNLQKEGVGNASVIAGEAVAEMGKLPLPNRIFVGGGGAEVLAAAYERLLPGGWLVMTGVLLETIAPMSSFHPEERRELLTVQVNRAQTLVEGDGTRFTAENPITIGVWQKNN